MSFLIVGGHRLESYGFVSWSTLVIKQSISEGYLCVFLFVFCVFFYLILSDLFRRVEGHILTINSLRV